MDGKWAKGKDWCWTLNNYNEEEVRALKAAVIVCMERKYVNYIVFGFEKAPTTGTIHLQGYVEFRQVHNLREATFELNLPERTHWEIRRGSRYQAAEYCKKEGNFEEYGVTPVETYVEKRARKRNQKDLKWEAAAQWVHRNPHLPLTDFEDREFMAHNLRYFEKYQAQIIQDRSTHLRDVECTVLWGVTGSGKSYFAYKFVEERELDNTPYLITITSERDAWWDGYTGQKHIILDEFDPHLVNKNQLKRILDKYPLRLPIKGSFTYANWDTVIITSNYDPKMWYANEDKLDYDAIQRRLTHITHFPQPWRPPSPDDQDLLAEPEDL